MPEHDNKFAKTGSITNVNEYGDEQANITSTNTNYFLYTLITATGHRCCGNAGGPVAVMNHGNHTTGRIFAPGIDGIYYGVSFWTPSSYSEPPGAVQGGEWPALRAHFEHAMSAFFFCIFCNVGHYIHNKYM
jgi:hypothetical protein